MNWSLLLPSTWDLVAAIRALGSPDSTLASRALSDVFVLVTIWLAVLTALWCLVEFCISWGRSHLYLRQVARLRKSPGDISSMQLRHLAEFRHHLVTVASRDGTSSTERRRTVDAHEVLRDSVFAPSFTTSRFFLSVPGILTGLGVLGTFVGLQLGLGGLDLNNLQKLDRSIIPLIEGCAIAFSTSVWGVTMSLVFSGFEKALEGRACAKLRRLQNNLDSIYPRYVPEEAMSELERSSRGSENLLKGLAVAIGEEMQKAIGRLGQEIKDAVSAATAEGQADLMKGSAELISSALTAELASLKDQIAGMGQRFTDDFSGVSRELVGAVGGFQPVVETLSKTVDSAQAAVGDAVAKLTAHEGVMDRMAEAASNIRAASDSFASMNTTLADSTKRNEEAAKAQLSASEANQRVAGSLAEVGSKLPELQQTLIDAARVIGSLGAPISSLQSLLASQPELQKQLDDARASAEEERGKLLLQMSSDLAEKVGAAAAQFEKVGELAETLQASAESLNEASNELAVFGQQVVQASTAQKDSADASRHAAAASERAAAALEPLPSKLDEVTGGLEAAGRSMSQGAETALETYRELVELQHRWQEGAQIGLHAMRDRLQEIISNYGDQISGQTRDLMKQWVDEVSTCLRSFDTRVEELQGMVDELQSVVRPNRE